MTFHDRKTFYLINDRVRANAIEMVRAASPESVVTVSPKTRTNEQNAKLHAMLSDLARSDLTWAGKRRTMEEWKALMISAHAVATNNGGEVIPGIEGEFVAIRESSAQMSVSRAASLIEYLSAFCATHGVEMRDTSDGGWNQDPGSAPLEPEPEAGAIQAREEPVAASASEFSEADAKWLVPTARQMWAFAFTGEPARVKAVAKSIIEDTPAYIGKLAREKAGSILVHCLAVAADLHLANTNRRLVAGIAGISEAELREVET